MSLRILNVAYPFAPAGPDAVGGAEQVVSRLDAVLRRSGHTSILVGCKGSKAFGQLWEGPAIPANISAEVRRVIYSQYKALIQSAAIECKADLIHLHGVDFHEYIPDTNLPILATLHLPPAWYPAEIYNDERLWLNCVSDNQHCAAPRSARMLSPIPNGVPIPEKVAQSRKSFALALGRICPEKGFHFAFDAARHAGIRCYLGGEVFPYPAHQEYFDRELRPRVDGQRRFIGPLNAVRKSRFYASAQCLLVPSLVPETSSLVAMEALAHGTPVIAFPCGALPTLIENGKTGFIVSDVEQMAEAIQCSRVISPAYCRAVARERFSLEQMTAKYLEAYERIISRHEPIDNAECSVA